MTLSRVSSSAKRPRPALEPRVFTHPPWFPVNFAPANPSVTSPIRFVCPHRWLDQSSPSTAPRGVRRCNCTHAMHAVHVTQWGPIAISRVARFSWKSEFPYAWIRVNFAVWQRCRQSVSVHLCRGVVDSEVSDAFQGVCTQGLLFYLFKFSSKRDFN